MNNTHFFAESSSEAQLIAHALDELRKSTGIEGEIISKADHADAQVSLQVAGRSLQYSCEVKAKIDRFVTLDDLKARSAVNRATLLICHPLTDAIAARCHELDIQFIDTAGNAYLDDQEGVLIYVTGRKSEKYAQFAAGKTTITPAALRVIFAFLADPSMLNAPYRDISTSVQVSIGAVGNVFDVLERRGFIGTAPGGNRIITSPEQLLSEWAVGYMNRLRPKLKRYRFTSPNPSELRWGWNPEFRLSAWGGEVAAEIITKHLNPATFTLYMDMDDTDALPALVKRFRLQADPHGPIEVIQPFWNMEYFDKTFPTVPLHLVYADLLGTNDPRNLSVAKQISQEVFSHVQGSKR